MDKIVIFDTTLRDGLQSPGVVPVNHMDRVKLALALNEMKVDVIEAGFAVASKLDFDSIATLAQKGLDATICSLARCHEKDIDAAGEALKGARSGRIHTFISTSPLHMEHKLGMSPDAVLDAAVAGVKRARGFTDDVQFSLEDFTRTEEDFACRLIEAVIAAGANTINLPDTVGYAIPPEFAAQVAHVVENVPNSDKAVFSTHCHNDLGLAVANSLAGVVAGARQIECTVNGLGERAGNAAMEEVVMALKVKKSVLPYETSIDTTKFKPTSRLVEDLTGITIQRNKAIVGANAFAHESGIHQHGMSKNRETYEIMKPEDVGQDQTLISLGVTSGREGIRKAAEKLGYDLSREQLTSLYEDFMAAAQQGRVEEAQFRQMLGSIK